MRHSSPVRHLRHRRPRPARGTAALAACLAVAALGLSACGTEKPAAPAGPFAGKSGTEIVDEAVKATKGADALRIGGRVLDEETGRITMDLALDTAGRCAGELSLADEGSFRLAVPGDGLVYVKYSEKFLRAQSKGEPADETRAVVEMLAGRWAKTKATGADAKDISGMCDLDELLADFGDINSGARRGATTTVDGTPAIEITARDAKDRYKIYVATEGKPYLLKIADAGGGGGGGNRLSFTDYDKPVPARKPAGEVLDLDTLGA